jgi:glycosyltransferase involved in cell wall biosynthesis
VLELFVRQLPTDHLAFPPVNTPTAFFLYRDSALRREALRLAPGAAERYSLYGLDEIAAAGLDVRHNFEPGRRPGFLSGIAAAALDRAVRVGGGYSGDFRTVLACRGDLRRADVVFSTVDTVGIPLTLLARLGAVRTPIVYAAIGLPERIEKLKTRAARGFYLGAYRRLHAVVAYGWGEVAALRAWLGDGAPPVHFVPFGVDTEAFRPTPDALLDTDIVSVGADPRRDYELLVGLARRRPEWSFGLVASRENNSALSAVPANVRVETDLPFGAAVDRLRAARVVVLPVRDNSYSGATTVLLQAMASGKPVVVTRTAAIAEGYHLEDGLNCRLVDPGAPEALERAASELLDDEERAAAIGARARETVERHLTWQRYTDTMRELLIDAAGQRNAR